ncbi:hypothetical protein L596_019333 [Steinernema carpocapsae]|uniref:Uncharacterized protein n=1 Tax=Steinernema carpocapsae TaxID=34508 RepID=A0A4U5MQR6_STECR|nr:hypothetical protein L596_019333 [Steinernema carpocapsae]
MYLDDIQVCFLDQNRFGGQQDNGGGMQCFEDADLNKYLRCSVVPRRHYEAQFEKFCKPSESDVTSLTVPGVSWRPKFEFTELTERRSTGFQIVPSPQTY